MVRLGTAGVTKNMNVEYLKPLFIINSPLTVRASLVSHEGKIARIGVTLTDSNGEVCTRGELDFFLYPEAIARRKLGYPGKEAFF